MMVCFRQVGACACSRGLVSPELRLNERILRCMVDRGYLAIYERFGLQLQDQQKAGVLMKSKGGRCLCRHLPVPARL
jgi:hypothetical protein